ncbi:MAG: hypothetical protein HYZ16_10205 [Bacteroidetes bacterium]|jgi:predicted transcriptional regulator|nr:hypothetical protein [Bacteroidota bacterium]
MRTALQKAEYLKSLIDFVAPVSQGLQPMSARAQADRYHAVLQQEGQQIDTSSIYLRPSSKTEVGTDAERLVHNLQKCEKYVLQRLGQIELDRLIKSHEILLRGTTYEKYAGVLQESRLPQSQPSIIDPVHFLLERLNRPESADHPIFTSLSLFYLFDVIQPFVRFNQLLASVYFNQIMHRLGYGYNGLLVFEKHVFGSNKSYQSLQLSSLFPLSLEERLQADLTVFFEKTLRMLLEGFSEIEIQVIEAVKEAIGYKQLLSKQKNSFNYMFEMGFGKFFKNIGKLNDRQRSILFQLALDQGITTKEMVMKHRCDRKTIQRDFADLMDIGIVSFEGKTKTTVYHLSYN